MMLAYLDIDSFAHLADRQFNFTEGLNIVSGPNEAGKSTVFHALLHTLFTPSNPGKKGFEKELQRFLPLTGGDTIHCTLKFEMNGQYIIERSWGAEKRDLLRLPDGGVLTGPKDIRECLRKVLPVSEGTMKHVFLVYQSGLQKTLEELRQSPETSEELGSVMRKSLFETGGLSVERFRKKLDEQYKQYAERWDFTRNAPQNGRGIENPWLKGAGIIVEAWYAWKRLEAERDKAAALESERTSLILEYSEGVTELEPVKDWLEEYRDIFGAMKRRDVLAVRYERACELRDRHRSGIESWTKLETEREADQREIDRLENDLRRLEGEEAAAKLTEERKSIKKRFDELAGLKKDLETLREDLNKAPDVDDDAVGEMRILERNMVNLTSRLSAGDLRLKIRSKADLHIRVSTGIEAVRELHLGRDDEETIQAGGYGSIETDELNITAATGEEDADTLRAKYSDCVARLNELWAATGVTSTKEAENAAMARNVLEDRLTRAGDAFNRALKDENYEEIETAVKNMEETPARPLEDIIRDAATATAELKAVKDLLDRRDRELEQLRETYKDRGGATKAFSEAAVEAEKLFQEMEACGKVPGGYDNAAAFIADYESRENRRRDLEEAWYNFRERLLDLEKELPDESEEELSGRCADARENFEISLRKGKHLSTIREMADTILETLDKNTYTLLADACAGYFSELTAGGYETIELEEGLPSGARGKGAGVPFSFLSVGTQDVFALAVRLAAADIFLADKPGFLVLDDPLVNLDPERRELAAGIVERWADTKQVLLFTCHPEYLSLFNNGNVIEMPRG